MLIPAMVALVFGLVGALHFWWALSGRTPAAVLPHKDGKPVLVPGRMAAVVVGTLAWMAAACVWAVAVGRGWPGLCYALAMVMLLRAVGDFRYVGFFKRVRAGRFAELDTKVYTPLCLALAAGAGWSALKYQ